MLVQRLKSHTKFNIHYNCIYFLDNSDIMSIWHMPHNEVMKMPKLRKRIVCKEPATTVFVPQNTNSSDSLILTVDEYECIRLIDLERLSQEECANKLGVARTTAQLIYNNAREKMARALVYYITNDEATAYVRCRYGNYRLIRLRWRSNRALRLPIS